MFVKLFSLRIVITPSSIPISCSHAIPTNISSYKEILWVSRLVKFLYSLPARIIKLVKGLRDIYFWWETESRELPLNQGQLKIQKIELKECLF